MITPTLNLERALRRKYGSIVGVDEVGVGTLAGPVVAAAVILPEGKQIDGIRDSKLLSPKKRQELFDQLCESCVDYGIGIVSEHMIDEMNIWNARMLACKKAVLSLTAMPDIILMDGNSKIPHLHIEQQAVIGGDRTIMSIAAASIIAKVTRDAIMTKLHQQYPQYNFQAHKGYTTKEHQSLLKKHGPSPVHRQSFLAGKAYVVSGSI